MKAIEGISLQDLLTTEMAARKAEQVTAARNAIAAVLTQVEVQRAAVQDAKAKLAAAEKKLEGAEGRLAQLQAGNWGVLDTPKPKEE